MLQPKDLRIGNFIFDDDGIVSKIIGFTPFGNSIRCDEAEGCDLLITLYPQNGKIREGLVVESTLASPIPLTNEWLERCGFEDGKIRFSYHTHLMVHPYQTASQGIFPGEWQATLLDSVPHNLGQRLKYVHQLQNLIFALAGEELAIKL